MKTQIKIRKVYGKSKIIKVEIDNSWRNFIDWKDKRYKAYELAISNRGFRGSSRQYAFAIRKHLAEVRTKQRYLHGHKSNPVLQGEEQRSWRSRQRN